MVNSLSRLGGQGRPFWQFLTLMSVMDSIDVEQSCQCCPSGWAPGPPLLFILTLMTVLRLKTVLHRSAINDSYEGIRALCASVWQHWWRESSLCLMVKREQSVPHGEEQDSIRLVMLHWWVLFASLWTIDEYSSLRYGPEENPIRHVMDQRRALYATLWH